jgi:hypothetical protein
MSDVRSARRSPAAFFLLRKTKNTKWHNFRCFFLLGSSGFEVNTLHTFLVSNVEAQLPEVQDFRFLSQKNPCG